MHRDVAVAAAQAGRHLWVEKPAGRDLAETRAIAAAAHAAGVQTAVGFNYRNAPAVEQARQLVAAGRLGRIEQVSVRLLADYAAHPDAGLTWRFVNAPAGSGVLGDLASHGVDLARYVVGEITELVADRATFLTTRPLVEATADRSAAATGAQRGPVENEDYVAALLRFAGGARGVLESSRVAVGEQCTYGIDVHGSRGALAWDFRRMGELRTALDQDYVDAAYATQFVRPGDGELARLPAGRRDRHGLRRPQGGRAGAAGPLDRDRGAGRRDHRRRRPGRRAGRGDDHLGGDRIVGDSGVSGVATWA